MTRVRLAALGGDHCEEKQCRQPVCLANAVALHAGAQADSGVDGTPPRCLLRRHTAAELGQVAVGEAIPVH
jgi:hypothetical protein